MQLNFCLLLGLGALASCLPTTGKTAPRENSATLGVPFAELQSKYNMTDAQLAALNVSSVEEPAVHAAAVGPQPRAEKHHAHVCLRENRIIENSWIVQVPESWYMPKFRGSQEACNAWLEELDRSMPRDAFRIQSCRNPRGDNPAIVGWLRMHFTTEERDMGPTIEGVIARMGDPDGMVKNPKRIACIQEY